METYEQIKELFEANGDAQRAAAMSAYMRDQFLFYGIPTPQRRALIPPAVAGRETGRAHRLGTAGSLLLRSPSGNAVCRL